MYTYIGRCQDHRSSWIRRLYSYLITSVCFYEAVKYMGLTPHLCSQCPKYPTKHIPSSKFLDFVKYITSSLQPVVRTFFSYFFLAGSTYLNTLFATYRISFILRYVRTFSIVSFQFNPVYYCNIKHIHVNIIDTIFMFIGF